MNILILLIPIALALGVLALFGFFYAVNNSQYDDLDTPSVRAIFDEEDRKEIKDGNKR